MKSKTIIVPIYIDTRWKCGYALTVQPDDQGEIWLTPEQTDQLEGERARARAWAAASLHATSRPRRRTSKLHPPTVRSPEIPDLNKTDGVEGYAAPVRGVAVPA
jgi:hypothetical protein